MSDRDYDELFIRGTNAQREKLIEDGHKSSHGFEVIDIIDLLDMLQRQVHDLVTEILVKSSMLSRQFGIDYRAVRREAADVANFAHMIILKCDKELGK